MRSRPPTTALVCLAAVCLLAAAFFVLRAGRGERSLEGGTRGDAAGVEHAGSHALDAGDDGTATPELPAPPPRAAEAGTPATPAEDAEAVADARIEGLVLRPDGRPAALARVWRLGADLQPADSTVSDEHGAFAMQPAPVGRVLLYATHDDFAPSEQASFALAAGEQKRDLRLALREYGRIRGVVLDAHDVPRARIAVSCEEWTTNRALFAESDAQGRFEFAKVGAGDLLVGMKLPEEELADIRADAPYLANRLARFGQQRYVELAAGQTVDVVLGGIPAEGVRVFGRVRTGERPEPRTWVWVDGPELNDWFTPMPRARTDEQGLYELWVPAPGSFDFQLVRANGTCDLTRRVAITEKREQRLDFDLPGAALSGRVADAGGRPIAGVDVALATQQWRVEPPPDVFALRNPHCATDEQGRFRFTRLPAGRYSLIATPLSKPDADATFARGRLEGLELAADAELAGVELVLQPGCRIRGQVRGTLEGRTGSLRVVAFRSGETDSTAMARVDGDGSFVVRGLSAGSSYELYAAGAGLVSPFSQAVEARTDREPEVELALVAGARLRVRAKWPAGDHPPALVLSVLAGRHRMTEMGFEPGSDDELYGSYAPGACVVELAGQGGWKGSETVALESGRTSEVEVLLRRAP